MNRRFQWVRKDKPSITRTIFSSLLGVLLFASILVVAYDAVVNTDNNNIQNQENRNLLSTDLIPGIHASRCDAAWEEAKGLSIIVYIFLSFYIFLGVAIICDGHFTDALEAICSERGLDLSENVAGATFMAAGSSAPELAAGFIGTFLSQNDVGIGTILGSAVFNILIIIGITAILAGQVLQLDWKPLVRDNLFYLSSVGVLLIVIGGDNEVSWYETMVMLFFYCIYIFFLSKDDTMMGHVDRVVVRIKSYTSRRELTDVEMSRLDKIMVQQGTQTIVDSALSYEERGFNEEQIELIEQALLEKKQMANDNNEIKLSMISDDDNIFIEKEIIPTITYKDLIISELNDNDNNEIQPLLREDDDNDNDNNNDNNNHNDNDNNNDNDNDNDNDIINSGGAIIKVHEAKSSMNDMTNIDDEKQTSFEVFSEKAEIFFNFLSIPYEFLFNITIPKCSLEEDQDIHNINEDTLTFGQKHYMVTLWLSILWITILSYFMVLFIEKLGCLWGLSSAVMGLTFLAAGTSVPDSLSSISVAKEGKGDMAVSNAVGSNVFDICIGLGLPWFLKTIISGTNVKILETNQVVPSVIALLSIVAVLFGFLMYTEFRLYPKLGYALIVCYGVFVLYNLLS